MESVDGTAQYKSSWFYMAVNLVWSSSLVALVTLRFLPGTFKTGDAFWYNGLTVAVVAACVLYFIFCRFVVVTVDEAEVAVRSPFRRGKRFSRAEYAFTSRFHTYSYKNIPVWTRRFLIAEDGQGRTETSLPNFTQRTFSLLMAALRKPSVVDSADARAITAEFVIPKDRMLAEYRRFMLLVVGAIFVVTAAQIILLGSSRSNDSLLERLLVFGGVFCFFLLLFGVPMLLSYRGKKRRIPERVTVRDGMLHIDDTVIRLSDIRGISATPPSYGVVAFGSAREFVVDTDWERIRCNCGMRSGGRLLKTVFTEYAGLCQALERVAAAQGFSLVYSL